MDDTSALILFRKYNVRLFRTAFRITASQDESEEIMQETLIRFIRAVDSGSVFPEDKDGPGSGQHARDSLSTGCAIEAVSCSSMKSGTCRMMMYLKTVLCGPGLETMRSRW